MNGEEKFIFNYILNDMALSSLITRCLYSDSANRQDKHELEHQIQLLQQENKQLEENWNKLKAIAKSQSDFKQKLGNDRLYFEVDELLAEMQELEKGDSNE